jgi:ATP-dependent Zn protease
MHSDNKSQSRNSPKNDYTKSPNSISKGFVFNFSETQQLIRQKRLKWREKLKSINILTLLSIFPFVLGVSSFLSQKYYRDFKKHLVEKNLPTISLNSEKLHWETLNYIFSLNSTLVQNSSTITIKDPPKQLFTFFNDTERACVSETLSEKFEIDNLDVKINKLSVSENFLFLNKQIFLDLLGQKRFTGYLKNIDFGQKNSEIGVAKNTFLSPDVQFFKLDSQLPIKNFSFFQFLPRTVYEMPAYLDSFFEINQIPSHHVPTGPLNLNLLTQKDLPIEPSNFFSTPQKQIKFNDTLSGFTTSIPCLQTNFFQKTHQDGFSPINSVDVTLNSFYKFRDNYYSNLFFLNNELKNLFLEKKIIPDISSLYDDSFLHKVQPTSKNFDMFHQQFLTSKINEKTVYENLINYLDSKILAKEFIYPRKMSGYRYPDMLNSQIFWVVIQNKYFSSEKTDFIKIHIPSIYSSSSKYNLSIDQIPSILIYTKPQTLVDFEKGENVYEGLALVLDKDTGLDWYTEIQDNHKTKSTKWTTLRSWFEFYLSQTNPLVKSKENFFISDESCSSTKFLTKPVSWLTSLPIYYNRFLNNTEIQFFPTRFYTQIPFFSESDWKSATITLKKESENNKLNPPLIQIQLPKIEKQDVKNISFDFFSYPKTQLSSSSFLNVVSPLFDVGRSGKLDYDFSFLFLKNNTFTNFNKFSKPNLNQKHIFSANPSFGNSSSDTRINLNHQGISDPLMEVKTTVITKTENLVTSEKFLNSFVSGRYRKLPSLFSKAQQNNFTFFDNWESLTFNSWLVVSQLSFAFLSFQILKALADNYGRELLVYLLDLVAALGFLDDQLKQEIEILMGQREKGFRIIPKSRKTFKDIAGIESLLPEISEIVWFLRNSARQFSMSQTVPKGVLLIGPPGTGKTLLVQALAGEAEVPVLALAGSSLIEPGESSAVKLEILFQEARRLAPCIVFIDEVDTLAKKRHKVIQNPMGKDELIESLNSDPNQDETTSDIKPSQLQQAQILINQGSQREQLRLLMQFLVELDGIQGRDGVIVIGATNRPEMLDQAVLRPGRFDKILELGLPTTEKRVEILKLYGARLGYNSSISWEYFADRTVGFTAADLAILMNESSIKAILNETQHTVDTVEYGIDRITCSETDKFVLFDPKSISKTSIFSSKKLPFPRKKQVFDYNDRFGKGNRENELFFSSSSTEINLENPVNNSPLPNNYLVLLRLAYYQAGKIVLSFLLPDHLNILVSYLWPRRSSLRSGRIAQNLQHYYLKTANRRKLETRVIGSYAGKAAEILFLQSVSLRAQKHKQKNNQEISTSDTSESSPNLQRQNLSTENSRLLYPNKFGSNLSTLGLDDLFFAQGLISLMVQNWDLYSHKASVQSFIKIVDNLNSKKFSVEKLDFFSKLNEDLESACWQPAEEEEKDKEEEVDTTKFDYNSQNYYPAAWWQNQLLSQFQFVDSTFLEWYRLYLPNLSENELNLDWVPPDEFYHSNLLVKKVRGNKGFSTKLENSRILWNDMHRITRDYQTHSFVLQSFNTALAILDENRELLDRISIELLCNEILREPLILTLIKNFSANVGFDRKAESTDTQSIKVVESFWGKFSRKKLSHWIDFTNLN